MTDLAGTSKPDYFPSGEVDDVLEASGAAHDRVEELVEGIAAGDHLIQCAWPAVVEGFEVVDRIGKGLAAGVHDADDGLVAEDQVGEDGVGVEGLELLGAGDAGEDEEAVGGELREDVEGELGGSEGLVDEMDGTDLLRHLGWTVVCCEEMYVAPMAAAVMDAPGLGVGRSE